MLDALKKLFRVRTLDLEAKLRPTEICTFGGVGEVEIEVWSDGTRSRPPSSTPAHQTTPGWMSTPRERS